MAAHVLSKGAATPGKTALEVIGSGAPECWRYDQLISAIRGIGTGLLDSGGKPGDIVLLRLGNSVDFPLAYLGAIAAGLVPVPTSAQLTEAEVARIIADLSPVAILRDAQVPCPDHPGLIGTGALRSMRTLPPVPYAMGDPDRLAYIVYTSGTSGVPRAVAHAHRAIWARQMMMDGWYGLRRSDRLCHAGAFNWTYTLGTGLMDPWTQGATALIPNAASDLTALPDLLKRHGATIFAAAPGVYRKILQAHETIRMPALRHGLSAGEKLSRALHDRWQAATGTDLLEAYGMSECSTFISSSPDAPARGDAIGRPQKGRRVAILGANGPVPQGAEGTIAVHRDDPGLMLGYLGAPQETAARFRGDWFLTGDQGAMAVDGQISYLGRTDDMMNAGGYRISPLEVEAVLNTHPDVTLSAVTEVEAKADARIIVAFYTAASPLDDAALRAYVADRLAAYKTPRAYVHLPDLPTGANGKLLRRVLRQTWAQNQKSPPP